jgi:hypothetical protein
VGCEDKHPVSSRSRLFECLGEATEWKDKSDQVIRMETFYPYDLQHLWLYMTLASLRSARKVRQRFEGTGKVLDILRETSQIAVSSPEMFRFL